MAESYHTLTRNEIRGFDKATQDLLIEMMGEGWTGRRSKGSHIQLQGPDLTTRGSISPSNRNNANYLRQLRNRGSVGSVKPAQPKQAVDKVKCPRPGCYKVYASLEYLNAHINADHEHKLKCPDCDYYGDSTRRVNLHRSKHHGYESPKKAQRLKAQAKREEAKREEQKLTGSPYAAGQAAIAALFAGPQAEPAIDEELTSLFEVPTAEQAVPAATPLDLTALLERELRAEAEPAIDEELTALFEVPTEEQAVPAETTDNVGTQSLELAPIRDLTVAQLIAVAAAMGETVEITVK